MTNESKPKIENLEQPEEELSPEEASAVAGGGKSGRGQQEFLVMKMNDVLITSVTHGGAGDGASVGDLLDPPPPPPPPPHPT